MATPDEIKIRIIAADEASKVFQRTGQNADRLKDSLNRLKVAMAAGAVATGFFLKSVIDTGAQVQQLRIRLRFLTGSVEDGAKAFETMNKYASEVPFALEEIQQGAAGLLTVANNVDELGGLLEITGDIAAGFGLSFVEASQQLQRAFSAGISSADLFRERGVSAFLGFQSGVTYSAQETRKQIVEAFQNGTATVAGSTKELADTFAGQVSMMQDAWFQLKLELADTGLVEEATKQIKNLTDILKDPQVIQGVKIYTGALLDLFKFVTQNAQVIAAVGAAWLGFQAGSSIGGVLGKRGEAIGGVIGSLTAGLAAWGYLNEAQADFTDTSEEVADQAQSTTSEIDKLSTAVRGAGEEMKETKKQFELAAITIEEVEYKGIRSLEDALVDIGTGAKSAKEAFKDMARSILEDMLRMQIRGALMGIFQNGVSGAIGGMFGGYSGTPTSAPYQSTEQAFAVPDYAPPSFQGGGYTGMGSRAGGVDGKGGFPAILHPNETVVDHSKGQGGGVNVTLNISTGVSQTVRAEIANMLPQITQATKAAVADARMRGGSFSKAMVGA